MKTITTLVRVLVAFAGLGLLALNAYAVKTNTTTTLDANPKTVDIGQEVTLTAIVTPSNATGTVTFKNGTTTIGTATLFGGVASTGLGFFSAGSRSLTAVYEGTNGGNGFNPSTSAAVAVSVIARANTTTALVVTPTTVVAGQSVSMTATVTGSNPTGSVQFDLTCLDGAGAYFPLYTNSATLSNGSASISASPMPNGACVGEEYYFVQASYSGDSANRSSVSGSVQLSVLSNSQTATTTTLSANPNPSAVGQAVSLTAVVTGSSPTGTVTFKDGAATLGTGTISAGTASLSTSALTVGSHSLSATYGGDASNATSTSAALTQTVNKANTSTVVTSSANPTMVGQSTTFTATVTGATPTGSVAFKDGTSTIGTGTIAGGVATFATSSLNLGARSITAVYAGDANNNTSTSAALTQTVNKTTTTTALTSSVNPSVVDQGVTFTATVTGIAPTGTVTFKDGATTIGTGTVAGGVVTFATAALAAGSHSVTAVYAGDSTNLTSTSSALVQVVNPAVAASTTALTSSVNPSAVNQSTTLTATVTGSSPTGTVTFKDGATTIGTGTVSAGVATLATSFSSAGSKSLTAVYGGDANNTTSTSAALTQTVNKVASATTLASSANPSVVGQSVTFTATVTGATPTGTVTFKDGATTIGTGTIAAGVATFATTSLAQASHSITAVYGGDDANNTSTSAALSQVVNPSIATSTTALSSSANPSVINQGVTLTATVTGSSPTGTVTFNDGATTLGTGTLTGSGNTRTATHVAASLAIGSHSITAAYAGDAGNNASTSSAMNQVVNVAGTTTSVVSSVNPSASGQSVTFTATVTGSNPTGTVTFKDGATTLGTGVLAGTGNSLNAAFATSTLSIATHGITAAYAGDANNGASVSSVLNQVVATNQPDLSIGALTIGTIVTNQNGTYTIPVTYTVTNVGTVNALPSWLDMGYLSADAVLDNADQASQVSGYYLNARSTALAPGASYTVTANFVTTAVATGSHTLFVKTDGRSAVYNGACCTNTDNGTLVEASETNNAASAVVALSRPDLSIGALTIGTIVTNQNGTYTIPVTYTVTNVGTVNALPNWQDMAYLSTDGVLDNGDQASQVSGYYLNVRSTALAPGGSYTITANFVTTAVAPGSYTLFVKTDGRSAVYNGACCTNADNGTLVEIGEVNNVASATVALARPDLSIGVPAIGTIVTNQNGTYTIPVTYTVTNVGTVNALPNWQDMAYLSTDGVLDNGDQASQVSGYYLNVRSTALAPGASYTITANFVTTAVAPGGYTLFVKTDGRSAIYNGACCTNTDNGTLVEGSEVNNVASAEVVLARPDLSIGALTIGTIVSNQNGTYTIPVTYTVTNVGTVNALNYWNDMAYLSADGVLDNADQASQSNPYMLYTRTTPLAPGANYTVTANFTTTAVAPGGYAFFVKTDAHSNVYNGGSTANTNGGTLVEASETNNAASASVALSQPDLSIGALTIGTIVTNQSGTYTIPVTYTVTNVGTVTVQPNWADMAYLSTDGVLDNADQASSSPYYLNWRSTALAPEASYTVSTNFTTSATTAPASYTFFVKTDARSNYYPGGGSTNTDSGYLTEASESNNAASADVLLKFRTTVGISASASAVTVGQSLTFTANVSPASATGTVTFRDGTIVLGTSPVGSGIATYQATFYTAGSHSVTATYSGDLNHESGVSAGTLVTASAATSSNALTATPNPVMAGQMITLTAVITGVNPTGNVTFKDGAATLGIYAVTEGAAELTTNFTVTGAHIITATYAGDANNQSSQSNSVTVNVAALPVATGSMVWSYGYDASGNVKSVTDPNGHVTQSGYDLLGRLSTLTQPPPTTGAAAPVITTSYDGQDNVKQVIDPRNLATTYTVDGLGNRKATASPDAGTASATFDAIGNVLTRTDAHGKITTHSYDDLNRLTQVTPASGSPTVYEYDGGSNPTPPPNSKGRLTKITDESGSTAYTYDGFGRVLTKAQTVGSGPAAKTFVVGYTWSSSGDTTGKLMAITYPSGSRVNLGYDSGGRLASINANPVNANGTGTDFATTMPVLTSASYNGANDLLGWAWGDASAHVRTFDEYGRLASLPLGNPSGSGAAAGVTRTVTYDNGYGVIGFTHSRAGAPQPALDQTFVYDALDRLVDATVAGNHSGYGYDATGNRSTRVVGSTTYTNGIAATSNRLTQVQSPGPSGTVTNTYVHDLAGNLTQDGAATYAYSDRGRMSSATVAAGAVTYLHNGLEQRVLKSGPTALVATGVAYFVYDEQGRLLGQYDANLTPIHETVYFGDTPVAVMKRSGSAAGGTLQVNLSYVYADQINAPRVITRASDQAIVWRWDAAEAFGATVPDENPSGIGAFRFDQRFPGQVYDAETGNFDNWHRTYRPGTGRYDSSDPIGLEGGINPYRYAYANTLTYSDPSGLEAECSVLATLNGAWSTPTLLNSAMVGPGSWSLMVTHLRNAQSRIPRTNIPLFPKSGVDCWAKYTITFTESFSRSRNVQTLELCTEVNCGIATRRFALRNRLEEEVFHRRRDSIEKNASAVFLIAAPVDALGELKCLDWVKTLK